MFDFSYLRLDVDLLGGIFVKPAHVDLTVKVSDVADDGVVLHAVKVTEGNMELVTVDINTQNKSSCSFSSGRNLLSQDDVLTASGGDKDVSFLTSFIHGRYLVAYKERGLYTCQFSNNGLLFILFLI